RDLYVTVVATVLRSAALIGAMLVAMFSLDWRMALVAILIFPAAYRIGHWLWNKGRRALAIFLQNQVSVSFQVDIHPAAKIGRGI
ncbi:hypothetical protein MJM28_30940, partial [Salmonella enterica subsp. enterica serovar Montevideo]|nr:hypothetical protein [Salmonella enterica subsp. enterica serovar Montevideo]